MIKSQSSHPILEAIKLGHEAQLLEQLEREPYHNEIRDSNGNSLLHIAVRNGCFMIVAQLLKHGARIEARNLHNNIPLHLAVRDNRVKCVALLMQYDTDAKWIGVTGNGERVALHYAARYTDGNAAQLLIERASNINAQDKDARTPLHEAIHFDNMVVAKQLLAKGAHPSIQDRSGFAPIHLAMQKHNLAMIVLLLEYGASFEQRDLKGKTAFEVSDLSSNALMKLAIEQHVYSEALFCAFVGLAGLDLNCTFAGGMGLLHIAAMNRQPNIALWLLKHGIPIGQLNNSYYTALHISATLGDLEMVKLLVENGAEIKFRDRLGDTAIDKAEKQLSELDREEEHKRQQLQVVIRYLTRQRLLSESEIELPESARASTFTLNPVIITERMQRRKLIGERYYQMTRVHQKEAIEIAERTGLEIPFVPDEEEKPFTLGQGNFGKIKVAFQRETGEYVASKKVKGERNIQDSMAEAYIQRESAGPNVLRIYNTIELREVLYHFMPLAGLGNGRAVQSLLASCSDQALREHVLIYVARDILTGLQTCHANGIYHLDIKPENIVFRRNGEGYITDFGCAKKAVHFDSNICTCLGDTRYFSPERYRAARENSVFRAEKADLWAAGLTLLEIASNLNIVELLNLPKEVNERFLLCNEAFFSTQLLRIRELQLPGTVSIYAAIKALLVPNAERRTPITDILQFPCFRMQVALQRESVFADLKSRAITRQVDAAGATSREPRQYFHDAHRAHYVNDPPYGPNHHGIHFKNAYGSPQFFEGLKHDTTSVDESAESTKEREQPSQNMA